MASLLVLQAQASEPSLTLENGWVRGMPPGMKMTAAFGTLSNHGGETMVLDSWRSDQFDDVTLHRTELVDGVSRMREVSQVELAPGESLEMKPGGYHLMLMMPNGPMDPAAGVTMEVVTGSGETVSFQLPVEKR